MSVLNYEEWKKSRGTGESTGSTENRAASAVSGGEPLSFEEYRQLRQSGTSREALTVAAQEAARKRQQEQLERQARSMGFRDLQEAQQGAASYEAVQNARERLEQLQGVSGREARQERRELEKQVRHGATVDRRDALIEEYRNLKGDSIPVASRRNELREEISKLDEALGNGERDYRFGERAWDTFLGFTGQVGGNFANFAGTALRGIADLHKGSNEEMERYLQMGDAQNAPARGILEAQKAGTAKKEDFGAKIQDFVDIVDEGSARTIQRAKEGQSKAAQFGIDVGGNVLQMAYDAGIAAATGGASLVPLFMRSAGGAMQEARQAGATTMQQLLYGGVSGGIEVLTEKMADGLAGIYGAGAADNITEELIRKLTRSDAGRSALRLLTGAVEEGGEEVVSDLLAPYAQLIYNNKSFGETLKGTFTGETYDASEILYDFIIGATVGALGGGASLANGQDAADNAALRMTDTAESELAEMGVKGRQGSRAAAGLASMLTGEEPSRQQQRALRGVSAEDAARIMETARSAEAARQSERRGKRKGQADERAAEGVGPYENEAEILRGRQTEVETAENGKGKIRGFTDDGRITVAAEDGTELTLTPEEAGLTGKARELYEATKDLGSGAVVAYAAYEDGQDLNKYTAAWDVVQNLYGARTGLTLEQARQSSNYAADLTEDQFRRAFEMGRETRTTQADVRRTEVVAPYEQKAQGWNGSLSFDGGVVDGVTLKGVDPNRAFTAKEGAQIAYVQLLAKALPVDFVLFEGDAEGTQGLYQSGGKVYLNINAGQAIGETLLVSTAAHELTHFIQDNAPELYEQLKDAALEVLAGEDQGTLETLVQKKMQDRSLDYDEALDEVVADGCEMMLKDSKAVERLARENRTLAERIRDWLRDFAEMIKAAFTGVEARHAEAQAMMRDAEKLQKLWDDALYRAAHNRADGKKETAPEGGVKMSIDPGFSAAIDAWDGKKDKTFRLGSTSKALQSIGVKNSGIIWHSRKIAKILKEHSSMTRKIIKQVPQILEQPVMVLQSQSFNTRIIMLGEVYDEAGQVVTVALELQPTTKGGQIQDYAVVASAYGKDDSPQNFITKSGLLYVDADKNRTKRWMQGLGLQLPSDTTAFGSIGNITYQDGKVKIQSVPYKQYMQTVRDDVTYSGKVPATKTPMQLAFEEAKNKKSEWDAGISDRELLLEAAEQEGAPKAVTDYAKKVRRVAALERQEARLQKQIRDGRYRSPEERLAETQERIRELEKRTDAARGEELSAGEWAKEQLEQLRKKEARLQKEVSKSPSSVGSADSFSPEGGEAVSKELARVQKQLANARKALEVMEAGGELRQQADRLREQWWSGSMEEAVRTTRQLRQANRELRQYLDYYRQQSRLTSPENRSVKPEDVRRFAKALLKEHGSEADSEAVARRIQEIGDTLVRGDGGSLDSKALSRMAKETARLIIDNSYTTIDENAELRQEIKNRVRTTRLQASDELKGDIPDYNRWRKSMMGRLTLTNDGLPIDTFYQKLTETYGEELFPSDVTAHSDQIQQILDAIDKLEPMRSYAYSQYGRKAMINLVQEEILDTVLSGEIRESETMADRNYRRMAETAQAMRERAETAERQLAGERAERRDLVREKVKVIREELENSREARQKRINIEKLRNRLSRMLVENSKKNHIPDAMKADVGAFLARLDTLSPFAGEARIDAYVDELDTIRQIVQDQRKLQEDGDEFDLVLPPDLADAMQEHINSIRKAARGTERLSTSKMTLEQLRSLEEILTTISSAVSNANLLFSDTEGRRTVSELGEQTIRESAELPPVTKRRGAVQRQLLWDNTTPYYAFKRFGEAGMKLFRAISGGWSKLARNASEVLEFAESAYTAEEVNAWEKEVHTFELVKRLGQGKEESPHQSPSATASPQGEATQGSDSAPYAGKDIWADRSEVTMTTAQMMSLYCLWKREQARGHLLGAGIRVGDYKIEKLSPPHTDPTNYLLNLDDVARITGELTERQKEVCDKLMEYMNTVGSAWGNEISMKLWGIRYYSEENYFPIRTDQSQHDAQAPEKDRANLYRLQNMSFTKKTVRSAKNAIMLDSVFDVWANHMADMAKYNALSLPMLDAMRWYNYKAKSEENEEGQFTTENVKKSLESAFGKEAGEYFITFMQDLNGVNEGGRGEEPLRRLVSNLKVASVGANVRVALQQPTSIARAALLLDPKYIVKGIGRKSGRAKALQYSGLAVWKALGYFDTNINKGMREQIKHADTWADKLREKSMILVEKGDQLTWGALWNACELETADKTKLTGEELMKATAERFDQVILATQVMDSTLTRSQNMRSKSMAMGEFTAYMSEPTLIYNVLLDAYSEFDKVRRREGKGAALQKTGAQLGRTMAVYVFTAALTSMAAALADVGRDDDKYQTVGQKWVEHFWENFKDNVNPVQLVPILKDLVAVVTKDESKELMVLQPIRQLRQGALVAYESAGLALGWIEKPTDVTYNGNMGLYGRLYKIMQGVSTASGMPLSAAMREAKSVWNNSAALLWPNLKLRTYDGGEEREIRNAVQSGWMSQERAEELLVQQGLYRNDTEAGKVVYRWGLDNEGVYDAAKTAALADDREAYREALSELTSAGYEEKDIQSQIRTSIKGRFQGTDDAGKARISVEQAVTMLVNYGGKDREEATALVKRWQCLIVTGIPYEQIDDAFMDGDIDAQRAAEMRQTYGGYAAEDAQSWAGWLQFRRDNPTMDDITEAAVRSYNQFAVPERISAADYYSFWSATREMETDYDANGKTIRGQAKRDKTLAFIDSMPLSSAQKDALYYAAGYAEKTLRKAPWHQK